MVEGCELRARLHYDGIGRVLALRHSSKEAFRRQRRRHILQAVDKELDLAGYQVNLQVICPQALGKVRSARLLGKEYEGCLLVRVAKPTTLPVAMVKGIEGPRASLSLDMMVRVWISASADLRQPTITSEG